MDRLNVLELKLPVNEEKFPKSSIIFKNDSNMNECVKKLIEKYIVPMGPFEINGSSRCRKRFMGIYSDTDESTMVFDECIEKSLELMADEKIP